MLCQPFLSPLKIIKLCNMIFFFKACGRNNFGWRHTLVKILFANLNNFSKPTCYSAHVAVEMGCCARLATRLVCKFLFLAQSSRRPFFYGRQSCSKFSVFFFTVLSNTESGTAHKHPVSLFALCAAKAWSWTTRNFVAYLRSYWRGFARFSWSFGRSLEPAAVFFAILVMSADTVGTVKLTKFFSFRTSNRYCGRPLDNSFACNVLCHNLNLTKIAGSIYTPPAPKMASIFA